MIRALTSVQMDSAYGKLSAKTRAEVDAILAEIDRGGQQEGPA